MASLDARPVMLMTGASGTLGTALIAALGAEWDIAAVRRSRPLAAGSERETLVDPRNPGAAPSFADHPFEITANLLANKSIQRVVELTMAKFGRIDALVNVAGSSSKGNLVSSRVIDGAGRAFGLNALVPVRLAAAVTDACWKYDEPANRAANRCVVNLSAISSLDLSSARRGGVTAGSKAALNMLTCHLAADLAHLSVRVNAVAPAPFPSPVTIDRVVTGVRGLLGGSETGRILALWADQDELI